MAYHFDCTWPLQVIVDNAESPVGSSQDIDQQPICPKMEVRVRGDYTIGKVIFMVTDQIAIHQNWAGYAFWWQLKKRWLKDTRMTLDQLEIRAHDLLTFTPMYKILRVQMPDLNVTEMFVDFSVNVVTVVSQICSVFPIRHSEELSLARPLTNKQLKYNNPNLNGEPISPLTPKIDKIKSPSRANLSHNGTMNKSNGSLRNESFDTILSKSSLNSSNYSLPMSENTKVALLQPKSNVEKARLNSAWLDSSISLYEQNVAAYDLLHLKYKFFDFYDLNPKIDVPRINFIYEQLKWSIISQELECNDDELYTLAAINLQVTLQSGGGRSMMRKSTNGINGTNKTNGTNGTSGTNGYGTQNSFYDSPTNNGFNRYNSTNGNGYLNGNGNHNGNGHCESPNGYSSPRSPYTINGSNGISHKRVSDSTSVSQVDEALEELEKSLDGTSIDSKITTNGHSNGKQMNGQNNLLVIPELGDKLKISTSKGTATLSRFLKSEKTLYMVLRDTKLNVYKSMEHQQKRDMPLMELNIANCEVNPELLASQKKFCFQIIESRSDGTIEHWIRCRDAEQYAKWFTACKQASIGRTMAHVSYNDEVKKTLKLLQIQTCTKSPTSQKQTIDISNLNIQLEEFVPQRLLKRKSKDQILRKIVNVHSNFIEDSPVEAQMKFIKTCQTLRDYGITLFVIRSSKSKKEELLGISPNKLILYDINNGSVINCWRYSSIMDWNINWEVKRMQINFSTGLLEFECLTAYCKVIHEFIGGYIYMSMRNKDNAKLNETEFLKLTGGWNDDDDRRMDD